MVRSGPTGSEKREKRVGTAAAMSLGSNLAAIPLYTSAKERRQYDDLADLYSIIKVTEHLEKAYARDIVSADEVRFWEPESSGSRNRAPTQRGVLLLLLLSTYPFRVVVLCAYE